MKRPDRRIIPVKNVSSLRKDIALKEKARAMKFEAIQLLVYRWYALRNMDRTLNRICRLLKWTRMYSSFPFESSKRHFSRAA